MNTLDWQIVYMLEYGYTTWDVSRILEIPVDWVYITLEG